MRRRRMAMAFATSACVAALALPVAAPIANAAPADNHATSYSVSVNGGNLTSSQKAAIRAARSAHAASVKAARQTYATTVGAAVQACRASTKAAAQALVAVLSQSPTQEEKLAAWNAFSSATRAAGAQLRTTKASAKAARDAAIKQANATLKAAIAEIVAA